MKCIAVINSMSSLSRARTQLKVPWHMQYFVQIQVVMLRLCDVIHLSYLINILGSVLDGFQFTGIKSASPQVAILF